MNNEEYQKRVLKILMDIRTLNDSIDLRMSQQNQMNQKILDAVEQFQNFILEVSPKEAEEVPADLQAIQYKKYLSQDYKPAYVDDFKQRAFLRYNIHEDQMEFVKDDKNYR